MTNEFVPWPCCDLTQYPLEPKWTDTFPFVHLARWRYTYLLSTMRSMFQRAEISSTYALFRNYAFQQGQLSNANVLDMEFFYSMLAHDYPFFLGHKQTEIQADFNFNDKKYEALGLLKSSHFDLYRVEHTALGFAKVQSMTNPGAMTAFVSLTECPKRGDYIFARLMPIGVMPRALAYSVVEPWDTVEPQYIDEIVATFRRQHQAFCEKFPQTTTRAFMKICAYPMYELLQSYELLECLNTKLKAQNDVILARCVTYTFKNPKNVPALKNLSGAKILDGDACVTIPISSNTSLPETLREAILSREKNTLEITLFLRDAGDAFLQNVISPLLGASKPVQTIRNLDHNETYRCLRHLSIPKQPLF